MKKVEIGIKTAQIIYQYYIASIIDNKNNEWFATSKQEKAFECLSKAIKRVDDPANYWAQKQLEKSLKEQKHDKTILY